MQYDLPVSVTKVPYINSPVVMYIHSFITAVQSYIISCSVYMVGIANKLNFFYFYSFYFFFHPHTYYRAKIKEIYYANKRRYGYRKVTLELKSQGLNINHKKVQRLMKKFNLRGEKLYLSPILDAYGRYIVSYDISRSPNLEQINQMLNLAFKENENYENLIFHSNQGWQYQHYSYQKILKEKKITRIITIAKE